MMDAGPFSDLAVRYYEGVVNVAIPNEQIISFDIMYIQGFTKVTLFETYDFTIFTFYGDSFQKERFFDESCG